MAEPTVTESQPAQDAEEKEKYTADSHPPATVLASPADSPSTEPSDGEAFEVQGDQPPPPGSNNARVGEVVEPSSSQKKKPLSFYMTFLALNICVLLVSLDSTALSVAVPVIARELHGTTLEAFWASLCFLLAVVAVMPIITSLSNVLGRKIPLYASFVVFMAGSIAFALANDMPTLIVGRTLQGLGGGGLDVLGEVILSDITSLKERALYFGLFSIPMAGGAICGPIVGGALAEYASWRWIGWINLPIGFFGLVLFVLFFRLKTLEMGLAAKLASLDWAGMAFFVAGSTLFSLPLSWAGALYPWSSYQTLVPLILGLLILVAFGFYEARPTHALFPYRIFKNRTAAATLAGAFLHGAVVNGGLLYVLLSFQVIFADTPFQSAVKVLPICASIVAFSLGGAVAVQLLRRYKLVLVASWPCLVVGVGLFALWRPDSTDGVKYGPQVLAGVGLGVLFTVCAIPMSASCADVDDAPLAVGIMVSFRMFGGMTGLAVGSTVFHLVFEEHIAPLTSRLPEELAILADVREAVGFIPSLRLLDSSLPAYTEVIEAYRTSFMAVFLALTGLGAIGLLASIFIEELSLENEEMGRQGLQT